MDMNILPLNVKIVLESEVQNLSTQIDRAERDIARGRLSEVHVLDRPPDPGASNFCTHTLLENKCWIYFGLTHNPMYLDMGFEILTLTFCKLKV